MNEPKLVIVIPTKNRRALLERALASVFGQAYKNYRVVVINDGSTDGTKDYLGNLNDRRVLVIHHSSSLGVNAARNKAFQTLKEGEWAVPLDDDDFFLNGAFETMADTINNAPSDVEVLCFNSIIRTSQNEFVGGYQFEDGEKWYEPSYYEIITGMGNRMKGDNRPVWKWTVFPKHLFFEGVNGFEHIHWMELARDGVKIRYIPNKTTIIDQIHGQDRLSNSAVKTNRKSFARAHKKILEDHPVFFKEHPTVGMDRSIHALKIALRAKNIHYCLFFTRKYFKYLGIKIFNLFGR